MTWHSNTIKSALKVRSKAADRSIFVSVETPIPPSIGHFPGATGNTPSTDVYSTTNNQNSSWSYDGAGNLKTINGNTASYNLENEMSSLATTGATETMAYDAFGRRVQRLCPADRRTAISTMLSDVLRRCIQRKLGGTKTMFLPVAEAL